jgi:hypothetical protein
MRVIVPLQTEETAMTDDNWNECPVITREMINLCDDYTHLSNSWTIWQSSPVH